MSPGSEENSGWYVAELVMEICVEGTPSNIVHRNVFLIEADNADQAYEKASRLGRANEASYANPEGQIVAHRFRGISKLDEMVDGCPEDGAEFSFEEFRDVPQAEIAKWAPPKERLGAFRRSGPPLQFTADYRSREALLKAAELLADDSFEG